MSDTTPHWREDFPINWEDDHYVTRRSFTTFLTFIQVHSFLAPDWLPFENGGKIGDRRSSPHNALQQYRTYLLDKPSSFSIQPRPIRVS